MVGNNEDDGKVHCRSRSEIGVKPIRNRDAVHQFQHFTANTMKKSESRRRLRRESGDSRNSSLSEDRKSFLSSLSSPFSGKSKAPSRSKSNQPLTRSRHNLESSVPSGQSRGGSRSSNTSHSCDGDNATHYASTSPNCPSRALHSCHLSDGSLEVTARRASQKTQIADKDVTDKETTEWLEDLPAERVLARTSSRTDGGATASPYRVSLGSMPVALESPLIGRGGRKTLVFNWEEAKERGEGGDGDAGIDTGKLLNSPSSKHGSPPTRGIWTDSELAELLVARNGSDHRTSRKSERVVKAGRVKGIVDFLVNRCQLLCSELLMLLKHIPQEDELVHAFLLAAPLLRNPGIDTGSSLLLRFAPNSLTRETMDSLLRCLESLHTAVDSTSDAEVLAQSARTLLTETSDMIVAANAQQALVKILLAEMDSSLEAASAVIEGGGKVETIDAIPKHRRGGVGAEAVEVARATLSAAVDAVDAAGRAVLKAEGAAEKAEGKRDKVLLVLQSVKDAYRRVEELLPTTQKQMGVIFKSWDAESKNHVSTVRMSRGSSVSNVGQYPATAHCRKACSAMVAGATRQLKEVQLRLGELELDVTVITQELVKAHEATSCANEGSDVARRAARRAWHQAKALSSGASLLQSQTGHVKDLVRGRRGLSSRDLWSGRKRATGVGVKKDRDGEGTGTWEGLQGERKSRGGSVAQHSKEKRAEVLMTAIVAEAEMALALRKRRGRGRGPDTKSKLGDADADESVTVTTGDTILDDEYYFYGEDDEVDPRRSHGGSLGSLRSAGSTRRRRQLGSIISAMGGGDIDDDVTSYRNRRRRVSQFVLEGGGLEAVRGMGPRHSVGYALDGRGSYIAGNDSDEEDEETGEGEVGVVRSRARSRSWHGEDLEGGGVRDTDSRVRDHSAPKVGRSTGRVCLTSYKVQQRWSELRRSIVNDAGPGAVMGVGAGSSQSKAKITVEERSGSCSDAGCPEWAAAGDRCLKHAVLKTFHNEIRMHAVELEKNVEQEKAHLRLICLLLARQSPMGQEGRTSCAAPDCAIPVWPESDFLYFNDDMMLESVDRYRTQYKKLKKEWGTQMGAEEDELGDDLLFGLGDRQRKQRLQLIQEEDEDDTSAVTRCTASSSAAARGAGDTEEGWMRVDPAKLCPRHAALACVFTQSTPQRWRHESLLKALESKNEHERLVREQEERWRAEEGEKNGVKLRNAEGVEFTKFRALPPRRHNGNERMKKIGDMAGAGKGTGPKSEECTIS